MYTECLVAVCTLTERIKKKSFLLCNQMGIINQPAIQIHMGKKFEVRSIAQVVTLQSSWVHTIQHFLIFIVLNRLVIASLSINQNLYNPSLLTFFVLHDGIFLKNDSSGSSCISIVVLCSLGGGFPTPLPYSNRSIHAATDHQIAFLPRVHAEDDPFVPFHRLQDLFALHIPDEDLAVFASAHDESPSLRLVRVGVDPMSTAEAVFFIFVALIRLHAATFDIIPEPDAGIQRPREDVLAVGNETGACDTGVVFVNESPQALSCGRVPYSNKAIAGAAHYERAITDEIYTADWIRVSWVRAHEPLGADIPEEERFVVGTRCEHIAFRREGERVDVR